DVVLGEVGDLVDPGAVVRVYGFTPGARVAIEFFARPARHRLVCAVDVQRAHARRVQHPEDLADTVCQVPELFGSPAPGSVPAFPILQHRRVSRSLAPDPLRRGSKVRASTNAAEPAVGRGRRRTRPATPYRKLRQTLTPNPPSPDGARSRTHASWGRSRLSSHTKEGTMVLLPAPARLPLLERAK